MDSIISKEPEKNSVVNLSDIDSLFSEYTEPVQEEQSSEMEDSIENENLSGGDVELKTSNALPEYKENPEGDNRYYQSGKKKGQLKKKYRNGKTEKTPTFQGAKITQSGHQPTQQTISGEIISGVMFITLVDMLLPMVIVMLNNKFSKAKIKANDLQMTAKQRNELAPICDELMKTWQLTANPAALFFISLAGIYGMNWVTATQLQKQ